MEKALPKVDLKAFIIFKAGAPSMVKVSDKRPAVTPEDLVQDAVLSAASDFA